MIHLFVMPYTCNDYCIFFVFKHVLFFTGIAQQPAAILAGATGECFQFHTVQSLKYLSFLKENMIPNGCINFNAEIQFKEDFIGVQFPEYILSLLSQGKIYICFSKWDSQSPSLWLNFINFFPQQQRNTV